MTNTLKGVTAGGTDYYFDYEYLANKPIPAYDSPDIGKVLTVVDDGSVGLAWAELDSPIPTTDSSDYIMVTRESGEPIWASAEYVKELLSGA